MLKTYQYFNFLWIPIPKKEIRSYSINSKQSSFQILQSNTSRYSFESILSRRIFSYLKLFRFHFLFQKQNNDYIHLTILYAPEKFNPLNKFNF